MSYTRRIGLGSSAASPPTAAGGVDPYKLAYTLIICLIILINRKTN